MDISLTLLSGLWSRRHPLVFLCWAPHTAIFALLYLLRLVSKERLKENIFRFVRKESDLDAVLEEYWDEHESWIAPWYLKQRRDDDLVISASPEFVVKPMTDRLGIALMATPMDKKTGKIIGANCYGEEKVRRFIDKILCKQKQ